MPLRAPSTFALIPRPALPAIHLHSPITRPRTMAGASSHHAHEDHYDPPTGWLFGVPPGEKPKKEGWENLFFWGFFGSLAFGILGYAYKPDTSIQTWALEEARRRLEAEGVLPPPPTTTAAAAVARKK